MNENLFTGKAKFYDAYRPEYAKGLYDYLCASMNKKAVIADIGAGTGIFALPLIKAGYRVLCVEPNDDMRSVLQEKAALYGGCESIAASAENTGISPNFLDLVTVAQAFHWFDKTTFAKECRRILKPSGRVAIIYNSRNTDTPMSRELYGINKKYCPRYKGFSGGFDASDEKSFEDFFKDGFEIKSFSNDTVYNSARDFVGRCLSGSYALKKDDENYDSYVNELEQLFERFAEGGVLIERNDSVLYIGRVGENSSDKQSS